MKFSLNKITLGKNKKLTFNILFYDLSYIAIFPVFLLYFCWVSVGGMPFLGGYLIYICSLLLLPLLGVMAYKLGKSQKINLASIFFLLVFFYFFTVLIFYFSLATFPDGVLSDSISFFIYFFTLIVVFKNASLVGNKVQILNYFVLLAFGLSVLLNIKNGIFVFSDKKFVISYQLLAIAYVSIFLVTLMSKPVFSVRLVVYIFSIVVLFFNGARSEFIFILVFITIFEMMNISSFFWKLSISILLTFSFLSAFIFIKANADSLALGHNRIIDLMLNGFSSSSGASRKKLMVDGLEVIANKPLIGDATSYERGEYIHNILSAWVDFGAVGFLLYCIMLLYPLALMLLNFEKRFGNCQLFNICFSLGVSIIVLLIFSKNHQYLLIPFYLAMYMRLTKKI